MDLTQLANLGEFISGVAMLVTLAYLAVQIRQDAQSTRFLAAQGMIAGQVEASFLTATDSELAAIIRKGVQSEEADSLTPQERHRFNSYLTGFYVQVDFAYHQHLAGQLAENVWNRMAQEIPLYFHAPGMARWWAQDKPRFSPEFVDFVDRQVATTEAPEIFPTLVHEPTPTARTGGD